MSLVRHLPLSCLSSVALASIWCAMFAHQVSVGASVAVSPPHELPPMLSQTGLFAADGVSIDRVNIPFTPQYPLWTDGMKKRRWLYLPPGTAIDGAREGDWQFPVGTKLWKEFSAGDRRVETRLLWKVSETQWLMGSYAWNAEGTAATLAPDGISGAVDVGRGRRHSIPSQTDCTACHGTKDVRPLGLNGLQLSTDRDPNALHADPLETGMATVATLVSDGRLVHARADILTDSPRIHTKDAVTRTALGYMFANCAMCHNGKGEIAALAPVVRYEHLTSDADALARSFLGQKTRWQVPGVSDGDTLLVHPGAPDQSAILVRMRSRSPSSQMPPLGTVVRDDEAVALMTRWITGSSKPGS